MNKPVEFVNIKYDDNVYNCQNGWNIKIDGHFHFFPYSLCNLDKTSETILCPLWLVEEKELEAYILYC